MISFDLLQRSRCVISGCAVMTASWPNSGTECYPVLRRRLVGR
jgi:hypothetical protein